MKKSAFNAALGFNLLIVEQTAQIWRMSGRNMDCSSGLALQCLSLKTIMKHCGCAQENMGACSVAPFVAAFRQAIVFRFADADFSPRFHLRYPSLPCGEILLS
ncbi:MAG TPA: hypothetical protein PL033_14230 [Candidatus Brocadiia bacterium]|nr:hypothetical protein [Candidatus Brocadiia bacterium]